MRTWRCPESSTRVLFDDGGHTRTFGRARTLLGNSVSVVRRYQRLHEQQSMPRYNDTLPRPMPGSSIESSRSFDSINSLSVVRHETPTYISGLLSESDSNSTRVWVITSSQPLYPTTARGRCLDHSRERSLKLWPWLNQLLRRMKRVIALPIPMEVDDMSTFCNRLPQLPVFVKHSSVESPTML